MRRRWRTVRRRLDREYAEGQLVDIGELTYTSGEKSDIRVPASSAESRSEYSLDIPNQQTVYGAYLPSHRLVAGNYVPVPDIPTTFTDAETLFNQFTSEMRTKWLNTWSQKSPQLALKQVLIGAAVFGNEGNQYVDPSPVAREIWRGFLQILREVMPASIGFSSIRIRIPDIIVETTTGDFIIDEASGGISAIIEIAWQIFLRSRSKESFTVVIDEPENHLHPSLQRDIMPSLLRAFPTVQFVVSTHSPFVVTSSEDSAVYALDFNEDRRIISRQLDYANKAASADETLRNVLGVPSTMPGWAEQRFAEIVSRYSGRSLDEAGVVELRAELNRNGLATEFPQAIIRATEEDEGSGIE